MTYGAEASVKGVSAIAASSKEKSCPIVSKLGKSNRERDAHVLFNKLGLAMNVTISMTPLLKTKWPVIKPRRWLEQCAGSLGKLSGGVEDIEHIEILLSEFWLRYADHFPNHEVFQCSDSERSLARTFPMFIHGDEGRGKKRSAVMILNIQPVLGNGINTCKPSSAHEFVQDDPTQLNFKGNSCITRFLYTVMPRAEYAANPGVLDKLVAAFAK